jgi:hypothetical protein
MGYLQQVIIKLPNFRYIMNHERTISQRNDATSINNKRGMARRAKRNASKRRRQFCKRALAYERMFGTYNSTNTSPGQ